MGGAVAIYGAAKYPEIACVVAESTFLSFRRVVANWGWGRMNIPYFPYVPLALYFARRKFRTDPEIYSPVNNVGKVKVPALFINGSNDDLVPLSDADSLFSACDCPRKEKYLVPGASHTKCAEVGGVGYREKISGFLRDNLSLTSVQENTSSGAGS